MKKICCVAISAIMLIGTLTLNCEAGKDKRKHTAPKNFSTWQKKSIKRQTSGRGTQREQNWQKKVLKKAQRSYNS